MHIYKQIFAKFILEVTRALSASQSRGEYYLHGHLWLRKKSSFKSSFIIIEHKNIVWFRIIFFFFVSFFPCQRQMAINYFQFISYHYKKALRVTLVFHVKMLIVTVFIHHCGFVMRHCWMLRRLAPHWYFCY